MSDLNAYVLLLAGTLRFLRRMAPLNRKKMAKRLREARRKAGLTQSQLAEAAGVADETVSRIERAAYEPSLSTVVALTEALGVSLGPFEAHEAHERGADAALMNRLVKVARVLDTSALRALIHVAEELTKRGVRRGPGY